MYVEYSYKFRLYPNRTQENQILRTLGCCRFVFNHYLAIRKEVYERDGRTFNYYDCAGDVTQLKKTLEWLREVDAVSYTHLLESPQQKLTAQKRLFLRSSNGYKRLIPQKRP